jgi:hypothetical protein
MVPTFEQAASLFTILDSDKAFMALHRGVVARAWLSRSSSRLSLAIGNSAGSHSRNPPRRAGRQRRIAHRTVILDPASPDRNRG